MGTLNAFEFKHRKLIPMKKVGILFILTLAGYLFLGIVPTAQGFMSFRHRHGVKQNLLILKVDKPQWKIGYRIAADCPEEFREKEPELKIAMTTALQVWLEPLHALELAHPITNDFLFLRQADFHGNEGKIADHAALRELDARVTFKCRKDRSEARIALVASPDVYLRRGTDINNAFIFTLIHELGHALGLDDTYISVREGKIKNNGGLAQTVGTQPTSIMSGRVVGDPDEPMLHITEDDVRGILWLYKHFHEGLPIEDCFFPDYVLEEDPRGCIPKYPLIFELKHGYPHRAIRMLDEDPNLDVNAQDDSGSTALHYAVMAEHEEVVEHLLSQKRRKPIKPFLRDKHGRSALAIARKSKLNDMITLLLEHPLTLPVHPKDKLATTWGTLKKGY